MNREERRDLKKQGLSEEEIRKQEILNRPCTITEVVQLARSVSADEFNKRIQGVNNLSVAHTLHIEVLKGVLINRGLLTQEEFQELYEEVVDKFNEAQKSYLENQDSPEEEEETEEE